MKKKEKIGFGMFVGLLVIGAVWMLVRPDACAESPIIGTYKADSSKAETAGISGSREPNTVEALPTSNTTDTDLEKKITDILTKNPEIVVKALQKYSEKEQAVQQEKLQVSLMKNKEEITKESSAAVLGKNNADIKLVVFLDPNCPHCRNFEQAVGQVRGNYPNITFLMRHWAILGKDSEDVSRGLWAIKQQGADKLEAISKTIAASAEPYTYAKLLTWVKEQKLNAKKFEEDARSKAAQEALDSTAKLAQGMGLQGTPTSILVDKKGIRLVTPTDEKSLDVILKEASKA